MPKRRQRQPLDAEDAETLAKRTRHNTPVKTTAATSAGRKNSNDKYFTTTQGQKLPIELKKYWNNRYSFFNRFDEGIQIDEEGWYSVTPEVIAEDTAQRISRLFNRNTESKTKKGEELYGRFCVIDAFCGVGGNAIKFAEWCEHVIAIDIDPVRLAMARHNAEVYGVSDRIEFILGDFYELAPSLVADVVFMSPPWGGPEYLGSEVYDLKHMPFHSGQEWVDRARMVSSNIAYFMPRNCDPRQLADLFPGVPCDIEMNYTGNFFKAITAYYGDLAMFGSCEPRILKEL